MSGFGSIAGRLADGGGRRIGSGKAEGRSGAESRSLLRADSETTGGKPTRPAVQTNPDCTQTNTDCIPTEADNIPAVSGGQRLGKTAGDLARAWSSCNLLELRALLTPRAFSICWPIPDSKYFIFTVIIICRPDLAIHRCLNQYIFFVDLRTSVEIDPL